jgi:hypothetical protein
MPPRMPSFHWLLKSILLLAADRLLWKLSILDPQTLARETLASERELAVTELTTLQDAADYLADADDRYLTPLTEDALTFQGIQYPYPQTRCMIALTAYEPGIL